MSTIKASTPTGIFAIFSLIESFKTNDQTEWYAYPTTNQVSVTGLDAGATYKVRVRARYDDNKKSRWSDVVSGQTGVSKTAPPPVNRP